MCNGVKLMRHYRLISLSLFLLSLLFALVPLNLWALDSGGPRQQLEVSISQLLEVLRDKSLKGDEKQVLRHQRIADVVFLQFNMRRMSMLSLGRDWRSLSEAERTHFTELFQKLLKKSYVSTIDAYADEKIAYRKEIIKGDKAEVRTMLISVSRKIETPINYKLKKRGERWLVYDVIIENVSLVRNFRSQFAPLMKKKGFSELIAQMEKKVVQTGKKEDG
ncbi:MAG: ABC transporter substrate-binding protein [Deltaproteobacteria bacterium]|nr:ABC transporter substrate-binding protein [Candidatus Tharpella sp.]